MTQPRSSVFTSVRYAERRRWRSWTRIGLTTLAVIVVLAIAVLATLWIYASVRISGAAVDALDRADDGADNTLVVTTEGDEAGGIAIVQSSETRGEPAVLLLPRDLLVEVQGEGTRRLAAFHEEGGMGVLVDAVQDYTGISLDHYVEVSVAGVADIVSTLGGIPLCLGPGGEDCPVADAQEVTSRLAATGTTADDQPDRARRIHQVLHDGLLSASRPALLWNPFRTKRLIDDYAAAVRTDRDLGPLDLREVAQRFSSIPPADLAVRVVPGVREEGAVRAAVEPAEGLFQAFRQIEPLPDTGIEAPVELNPEDVTVRVLNGVGRAGLAAEMAAFLEDKGFVIESTDNAAAFDAHAPTRVRHPEGARDRGELVASFLPEVEAIEVGPVPDGVDVLVIVGADWGSP